MLRSFSIFCEEDGDKWGLHFPIGFKKDIDTTTERFELSLPREMD